MGKDCFKDQRKAIVNYDVSCHYIIHKLYITEV